MHRDRLRLAGRILIWTGILAWAPYAWLKYLRHADPAVLPFLTVHLAGVVPGALLSRWPRRERTRGPVPAATPDDGRISPDRREAT